MTNPIKLVFAAVALLTAIGIGATNLDGDTGGLASLRGDTNLAENTTPPDLVDPPKQYPNVMDRDFPQQPPLIPHTVRDYQTDTQANKCLSCHSWTRAKETGATRISPTHFESREGVSMGDVSPRRYFCMQCHVPQIDAKPLVDSDYKPAAPLQ